MVAFAELRKGRHKFRIQGAEDDVTLGHFAVVEQGFHVAVFGQVPGADINGYAFFLQRIACHQYAAIVFYHTKAVIVHFMQRQHHAQVDGLQIRHRGWLARLSLDGNLDGVTLLQLISWLFHSWIGLDELFNSDAILTRNAIHGFFFLHLVVDGGLRPQCPTCHHQHCCNNKKSQ